ncbi:winged helix-turn-helix domain-containing protein [Belnapia moabensis]|uniref:winged helix-turn-helix domain-containing protein n=1 Tax=Belnapia moabensis TaxID=365533 RepID=UPI001FDEA46A|nr:winged helix-turn-helix domain-containing protein [Belnapia moabensis]
MPIGGIGPVAAGCGYGQMVLLWVLNLTDGRYSLFDMAERAGLPFAEIRAARLTAEAAGLPVTVTPSSEGAAVLGDAEKPGRERA